MDNVDFPRDVIYRQREKLDDFDIKNDKSLNYILEYELFKLYHARAGYKDFAISILNAAYYVCTMAMADDDPMRSYGDYLQKVREIMHNGNEQTTLVLSTVLIIIKAHKWDRMKPGMDSLALQIFYEIEKNEFIRYSYYEEAKKHYEERADRTTLSPDSDFVRRPIYYRLLADNYSVEDLKELFGTDEDKLFDFIYSLGKNEEEQYTIASFLEDQMHSFFPDGWSRKAFFDYIKSGIHKKFHGEEERAIADAELDAQIEEDTMNYLLIQDAKERIPELEAENARLLEELEQKKSPVNDSEQQSFIEKQAARIKELESKVEELKPKREVANNDDWVVELFSHFCYEDVQVAQSIIDEMRDKIDPEIADIIFERKNKKEISPLTKNIEMWRVLHAAKILESDSYQNLNTALKRRKDRKQ